MSNYHVIKNKEGDWTVRKAGSGRVSAVFSKQNVAEKVAKKFAARSGGGEVRIHNRIGQIRDSDTVPPANDPCPPRDKKH